MVQQRICSPNTLTVINNKGVERTIVISTSIILTISHETVRIGEWCMEAYKEYSCNHIRCPFDEGRSLYLRQANMDYLVGNDVSDTFHKMANHTVFKVVKNNINLEQYND